MAGDGDLRVAVVGLGAVTSLGANTKALWEGARSGRVAIRRVRKIATQGFGSSVGGEIPIPVRARRDYRRPATHREPYIDFAISAAEEAMEEADLLDSVGRDRWAVVAGTCNAGLLSAEDWYLRRTVWNSAEPGLLPLIPAQALAEALAGAFGLRGPVISMNTACATGANAVGYAAELIRLGHADAVLTGGSDCLTDVVYAGFTSLEALSPESAAPYSRARRGLSLGEGSGMLVLCRTELAQELGRHVHAEVAGYGISADGYHPTAPHPEGEGAARAILAALEDARVGPDDVDYINGHGTGTPKNDSAETGAIRRALGAAADHVLISSTKSMIGHLLGGAGAVEAIVTVRALEEQVAPPTANFRDPDPDCDLDYVPNVARPAHMDVAISNNFGFGGANACLVLARPGATPARPPLELEEVVVTAAAGPTAAGTLREAMAATLEGRDVLTRTERGRVAEAPVDASPYLTPRDMRRMDRLGVLAVVAARDALREAELVVDAGNRARIGVIFGTGTGPMESIEKFLGPLVAEGIGAANPAVFPNTVWNAGGGYVAMHSGAVGPSTTVTAGHAAGAAALIYAHQLAATGRADAMIAVGADSITPLVVSAYEELGMLGPGRDFGLSDGAVAVVLERASAAAARGARPLALVAGYAMTNDGLGIAACDPEGKGIEAAMRLALERSGVTAARIAGVVSARSGHAAADAAEQAAIARVFGSEVRVLSPLASVGDPVGAAGTLAIGLAAHVLADGVLGGPVLTISSSMGGTSAAIVLRPV